MTDAVDAAPSDPREAVAEAWAEVERARIYPMATGAGAPYALAGVLLVALARRGLDVVRRPMWQPIETAPKDQLIWVWAAPYQDLSGFVSECRWHPDAGFCVDELRQPTHWHPIAKPEGPK